MLKRITQIFLVVLIPSFLASCLDGIGGCAPDYEEYQSRFYVVNLNGVIEEIEREWSKDGHGSLEVYGLDDSQNYLYYTDNSISSPEEIIRLNYQTGSASTIILDEDGKRFSLSPDGSLFAYEKIRPSGDADISIVSISDSSSSLTPIDTTVKSNRLPKWISNNEITYNAFGEGDALGIFKANIVDSTIEQLTELNGRWGYDVSMDSDIVVLSAENRLDDVLRESIFIKKKDETDPLFVGFGSYPRIIPSKDKFIYETLDGIWLSDFDGNTEILYSDGNTYLNKDNLAISPDGNNIVISNYDGLFAINVETKEVTQLTGKEDFVSGNGQWESINSSFNSPLFSSNGSKIFFSLTLNYFDDGC